MNSFLFSALTICLAAQCALASYQSASAYGNGYQQQRKMAPSPQTYGQQQSGYEMQHYEQANAGPYEQQAAYRAPSSASVSTYDERPAASYSKPAASYGKQSAGYGQQAAYAKPAAPKYQEPYYPPMPFAWGYDINDGYGGAQYHKENGDEYGKRTGSYGYTDAYGIYRQVDYVADEHGFRATIKTNEPGTANESPADVELHAYEPPSNYYAGNKDNSYSSAPAKSSYGQQQQQYGSSTSYSSRPQQQQYQPQQQAYGQQAQRSSYSSKQQSYSAPRPSYEQSQYSAGSSLVPVYQKVSSKVAASVAAKRY